MEPGIGMEVVRLLLRGRRTVPELVEAIYGVDRTSMEFHAYYMRVWRSIRELEAMGLVSAPLLGRDKGYRLTPHGLRVLLGLVAKGERRSSRVFSDADLACFAVTLGVGFLAGFVPLSPTLLGAAFIFLLGASTSRIASALGEVW